MAKKTVVEYTDADRETDFAYYTEKMPAWYKKYGKCYVAVRNKKMIGHFPTAFDAVEQLAKRYPMGTYIVQKCDADDSAYKIRICSFMIA